MEYRIDARWNSSHVDRKRLEYGYVRTDEIHEALLELQICPDSLAVPD